MEGIVKSKVEFDNGVIIEEGDKVRVVICGSGSVIEGTANRVAKKNIEIAIDENYICKVVYDDIDDVAKL